MLPTVKVRMEPEYLLIERAGTIATLEDQKIGSDACYREVIKNNVDRVLIDDRQLQFNTSILDQCDMVGYYNDEYEVEIRSVRVAFVVNHDDKELHDFWELYAGNRGYLWKVFREMDDAIAFLTRD